MNETKSIVFCFCFFSTFKVLVLKDAPFRLLRYPGSCGRTWTKKKIPRKFMGTTTTTEIYMLTSWAVIELPSDNLEDVSIFFFNGQRKVIKGCCCCGSRCFLSVDIKESNGQNQETKVSRK
jgi:hypothetical protein